MAARSVVLVVAGALAFAAARATTTAPKKDAAPTAADCAACHAQAEKPVTAEALKGSVHEALSCTDCHVGSRPSPRQQAPQGGLLTLPCPSRFGLEGEPPRGQSRRRPLRLMPRKPPGEAGFGGGQHPERYPAGRDLRGVPRQASRSSWECGRGMDHGFQAERPWGGRSEEGTQRGPILCHLPRGPHFAPSEKRRRRFQVEGDGALRRLSQAGLGGIHGQRALSGVEEGRGRLACLYRLPREHTIQGPQAHGSPVAPMSVPATCGKCHGDKASMANMGVPSDRVSTFMDSYHGVALQRAT